MLLLAKVLPDWAKAVKSAFCTEVLEHGMEVPGFSLRRRAGSSRITDPATALHMIVDGLGISHETLLQSGIATVSLAKLAGYVMEHNPVEEFKTKRDYVEALSESLGDSVTQGTEVVYLQKDRKPTDAELVAQLA